MANKVFGVEIRRGDVRIAVVDSQLRSQKVIALWRRSYDVESTDVIPDRIRSALSSLGFDPELDYVATVVPGEQLTCRRIEFPMKKRRQIEEVLPFELESSMPLDAEDICVAFDIIEQSENGATVLAAVARNDVIQGHLDFFGLAGVDPDAVVAGPMSAFRFGLDNLNSTTDAYVSLEDDYMSVTLIQDGRPVTFHSFPATDDPAKISGEIKRLVYSMGGDEVLELDEVILSGYSSANSVLAKLLSDKLGVKINFSTPDIAGATVDSFDSYDIKNPGTVFSSALGAARALAKGEAEKLLNLRSGEFRRKTRLVGQRGQMITAAALLIIGVAMWAISFSSEVISLGSTYKELKGKTRSEFKMALPNVTNIVSETQQLKNQYEVLMAKSRALGIDRKVVDPALDRLLDITRSVPKGSKMDVEELVYEDSGIHISGRTSSFEKVDQFKERLGRLTWAKRVTVERAKAGIGAGSVNFRLEVDVN